MNSAMFPTKIMDSRSFCLKIDLASMASTLDHLREQWGLKENQFCLYGRKTLDHLGDLQWHTGGLLSQKLGLSASG